MPIHIQLMFELFWLHLWMIQFTSLFYACWSCSSGWPCNYSAHLHEHVGDWV